MSDHFYIHGLRTSNFMKIDLVELEFKGPGLELVTGRNRSGKSSLLQSIYAALGGKMQLVVPPGQGHNMWAGFFQCQELVDFVIAQVKRTTPTTDRPSKGEAGNAK